MTASLIVLPHGVWLGIVDQWLTDLREIARLNCACRFTSIFNPIHDVCSRRAFSFADGPNNAREKEVECLCTWMRKRDVCFNDLTLKNTHYAIPLQWEELVSRSSEALQRLCIWCELDGEDHSFDPNCNDFLAVLFWASRYLRKLQHLRVLITCHLSPGVVELLFQNNCESLISIVIELADDRRYRIYLSDIKLPNLQVLRWDVSNLGVIVRGCPNLIALFAVDHADAPSVDITWAITQRCSVLRRLQLHSAGNLNEDALRQIGHGCPLLEYLYLTGFTDELGAELVNMLNTLVHLHTLVLENLSKIALQHLAARGHPSLRVLDIGICFTCAQLKAVTAALPELTELAIYDISVRSFQEEPITINLLEHCSNLERLHVGTYGIVADVADALLESAAVHCHHLHTLITTGLTAANDTALIKVVAGCPKLRAVHANYSTTVKTPSDRPNLVITSEPAELSEWLPEWLA